MPATLAATVLARLMGGPGHCCCQTGIQVCKPVETIFDDKQPSGQPPSTSRADSLPSSFSTAISDSMQPPSPAALRHSVSYRGRARLHAETCLKLCPCGHLQRLLLPASWLGLATEERTGCMQTPFLQGTSQAPLCSSDSSVMLPAHGSSGGLSQGHVLPDCRARLQADTGPH